MLLDVELLIGEIDIAKWIERGRESVEVVYIVVFADVLPEITLEGCISLCLEYPCTYINEVCMPRCDQVIEPDSSIVAAIGSSHIGIIHVIEIVGITAQTIVLYSCAGDFCGRNESNDSIRKHE